MKIISSAKTPEDRLSIGTFFIQNYVKKQRQKCTT